MRYRDRLFAGLMSLSLLAALTGCSASAPEQQIAVEVPSQQVLQADASQALVTLTIPSEYLPVQPDAGFDPTAYAVENGFADAVLEADGALTITMTQRYYDTFRAALYDAIAAQMTQATQTDYLSGLEYSEDFSSILRSGQRRRLSGRHGLFSVCAGAFGRHLSGVYTRGTSGVHCHSL